MWAAVNTRLSLCSVPYSMHTLYLNHVRLTLSPSATHAVTLRFANLEHAATTKPSTADRYLTVLGDYHTLSRVTAGCRKPHLRLGRSPADAYELRVCGEHVLAPLRDGHKPTRARVADKALEVLWAVVHTDTRTVATATTAVLVPRARGLTDALLAHSVVMCSWRLALPLRTGTLRRVRSACAVCKAVRRRRLELVGGALVTMSLTHAVR